MKYEIWFKDRKSMIVRVHENSEWRYRFDGTTTWISGMSLYTLLKGGWKKFGEVKT